MSSLWVHLSTWLPSGDRCMGGLGVGTSMWGSDTSAIIWHTHTPRHLSSARDRCFRVSPHLVQDLTRPKCFRWLFHVHRFATWPDQARCWGFKMGGGGALTCRSVPRLWSFKPPFGCLMPVRCQVLFSLFVFISEKCFSWSKVRVLVCVFPLTTMPIIAPQPIVLN